MNWKSGIHENHFFSDAKLNDWNRYQAAFNLNHSSNVATILEIRVNGKPVRRTSNDRVPLPETLHYEHHICAFRKLEKSR